MDFEHILDNIFNDLNEIRLHPRQVSHRLGHLKSAYHGNLLNNKIRTRQGVRALDNLVEDLNNRPGINHRLKWSFALHLAADQQAQVLGQNGIVTTQGTRAYRSLPQRIQQYAIVRGRISQVYQFGGRTAQEILQQLLIDDGLASRKRRNTLLDPIYKYVGVGTSYHQKLESCTVIILAEDIVSLVAPGGAGQFKRRKGVEQGKQFIFNLNQQILLNTPGVHNNNNSGNLIPNLQNAIRNDIHNYQQQNSNSNSYNNSPNYQNNSNYDNNSHESYNRDLNNANNRSYHDNISNHQTNNYNNNSQNYIQPQGRTTMNDYQPRGTTHHTSNYQNQQTIHQSNQIQSEREDNYRKTGPDSKDQKYEDNIHVHQNDTSHSKQKKKCNIM